VNVWLVPGTPSYVKTRNCS